jgi:hypothetical protein
MLHSLLIVGLSRLVLADVPQGLPQAVIPEGFGVNIHFVRPDEPEVDKLAEVGYRFVRMDFGWEATERKAGEYNFSEYDALVESMGRRGIRIVFILDYSNRLYDEGLSPHTDKARAAFANWAGAAAKHYAGKGILWEIWNEPNIKQFWKPQPNAEDYAKLALATIDAVKRADADSFIMGPASSTFPWTFFDVLAERGVFARLDAVSVHPYRQAAPETAAKDYQRLRELLDRASPRKKLPIVSGEWGYSTGWKNLSEEKQAQYLARQWLFNLANDVRLSIWYDWKDDGLDPKEAEHHFGSVYHDLKPKPATVAAKTLVETLRGYRFLRRVDVGNEKDWVLEFSKADDRILAVWTTGETHTAAIEDGDKKKMVELSGSPHYVVRRK